MPFPLIPAALTVCFLLMWALIAGMIFRDSRVAAENERDADWNVLPLKTERPSGPRGTMTRQLGRGCRPTARAAS